MNIYWPVYKNLEAEFVQLMFCIHIDDNQLAVYSSKIADLILRSAVEIESISKDLFLGNGGTKPLKGYIKYDDDALKHLNKIWSLNKKAVHISSPNCFLSKRELFPFSKNEKKNNGKMTYGWNKSYQHLKHERGNSKAFGSIKYLFDIMAALFLLNIYYSDRTYELRDDRKATSISPGLGSDIFSINIHQLIGKEQDTGAYIKDSSFETSTYYIDYTAESKKNNETYMDKLNMHVSQLVFSHPKIVKHMEENPDFSNYKPNWDVDIIGESNHRALMNQAVQNFKNTSLAFINTERHFEAILNKNQI